MARASRGLGPKDSNPSLLMLLQHFYLHFHCARIVDTENLPEFDDCPHAYSRIRNSAGTYSWDLLGSGASRTIWFCTPS